MRISDWSSDVCSSDLNGREYAEADDAGRGGAYSVADSEVEVVFNAAGMREEARSGFRQMYPSACTMKERCADQPIELADAHRARRLGDVRLSRSTGEASRATERQKIQTEVAVDPSNQLCDRKKAKE